MFLLTLQRFLGVSPGGPNVPLTSIDAVWSFHRDENCLFCSFFTSILVEIEVISLNVTA